jgi:hypothetical protein
MMQFCILSVLFFGFSKSSGYKERKDTPKDSAEMLPREKKTGVAHK